MCILYGRDHKLLVNNQVEIVKSSNFKFQVNLNYELEHASDTFCSYEFIGIPINVAFWSQLEVCSFL